MVEVIVEFDYDAQEPDELTIRKGDVIRNITMKPGGWWEGSLNEKRGMFPDNFVRVLESEVVLRTKKKRFCQAIYTYEPEHEDELHLNLGDVIEVLGEIEEGWWKGRLNEKEGVFPSNFVEEFTGTRKSTSKESLLGENEVHVVPSLPPKPVKTLYQALFDYTAQNDDELTLKVGDLITLISKDGQDKGWWRGELRSRIGVFPDNFVTLFPPAPQKKPEVLKIQPQGATRTGKNTRKEGVAPPVPGKKPVIPIKKSPLSLKPQKNYDNVDGAGLSKAPSKSEFDQVERGSMLVDLRQNRAKAPGRRPPSMVRDTPELTNGNHIVDEVKPKAREWEKNKVPWMDELKLNQAKKSPNSEMTRSRTSSEQLEMTRSRTSSSEQLDMTRSRTSSSEQLNEEPTKKHEESTKKPDEPTKKPEEQLIRLRTPTPDLRPIVSPLRPIVSPIRTPSPKPPPGDRKSLELATKSDLEERVRALEVALEVQSQQFNCKLDEVMKKLQNEIDLRQQLLIQVEKLTQCVTQV